MNSAKNISLNWQPIDRFKEAIIGDFDGGDGVRFSIQHMPSCYRRGPFRLLIEIAPKRHDLWGCFDDTDQPQRWYHKLANAESEAEALAKVLWCDRLNNKEGIV